VNRAATTHAPGVRGCGDAKGRRLCSPSHAAATRPAPNPQGAHHGGTSQMPSEAAAHRQAALAANCNKKPDALRGDASAIHRIRATGTAAWAR